MATRKYSFNYYLLIFVLIVTIPLISGLFYLGVSDVSGDYRTNYEFLQKNTEESIINSIRTVDQGLRIYDSGLDDEMKRAFKIFRDAYEDSGGDPSLIDLESLKKKMGERYDLYIIDENNVVVYTTNEIDQGLDFSASEDFSAFLDETRQGNSYVGDRVSKSFRDRESISKYAYYPTPDHKYILELSYAIKKEDARFLLKYGSTVDELKPLNPYLKSIEIYDIFGSVIGSQDNHDPATEEIVIREVIENKSDYTIYSDDGGEVTIVRYVDLSEPGTGSDMNLAVAFTYDEKKLNDEINSVIYLQIVIYSIFVALFVLFIILMTRRVTRPVRNLVEDVDAIAGGDYSHGIRSSGVMEFAELEKSISDMVDTITGSLREKTVLLGEVHHRVKNNLQIISGIIQLQARSINDENAKQALLMCENRIKTLSSVHDSLDMSENLSSIDSREHISTLAWDIMQSMECTGECNINLDLDIESHNLPIDIAIPISLIINEIVSNSLKYAFKGRENGTIGIKLRSKNGRILLDIWDDGTGMPEDSGDLKQGSLGLNLVTRLVRDQLKGTMTVNTERGTWYSFDIPDGEKK